jgi:hypothetical protein
LAARTGKSSAAEADDAGTTDLKKQGQQKVSMRERSGRWSKALRRPSSGSCGHAHGGLSPAHLGDCWLLPEQAGTFWLLKYFLNRLQKEQQKVKRF